MFKIHKPAKLSTMLGIALILLLAGGQLVLVQGYRSQISKLQTEVEQRAMRTDLKSAEDLRQDYFYTETATLMSPHTMRLQMDKGEIDFVLVDVRSAEDYQKGHIRGAISIPFDGSEQAINQFRQALEDGKKERRSYAVVYCYSSACLLGRKTGRELSKYGISVRELSIGYNDWELQHKVWNNPGEVYDINNYITRGTEPGVLAPSKDFLNRPCSLDDTFAC